MRLSGIELQQATGGNWHKGTPESISGISTDTRNFIAGHAFLALRGPNFDGHRFAEKVVAQAHALIGDTQGTKLWDNLATPQLRVEDTLIALGDIANAWRHRLSQTTVIAISGSYGKTTVRSMLTHLFQSLGVRTAATHANLNNLIGVPTTLLGIDQSAEVALIECGISEPGEMARLSQIVQPDIAIITGISGAHGAGLGGIKGVAAEKSKLMAHLLPQGWCLLGSGVAQHLQERKIPHPAVDMDSSDSEVVRWHLDGRQLQLLQSGQSGQPGQSTKLNQAGQVAELTLSLPASHWAANMALAATVALKYFRSQPNRPQPSLQEIAAALASWQAVNGRMAVVHGANGVTILDDSYNANPVSMQAALDTLAQLPGHTTAIIGDMAELEDAAAAHAGLRVGGIDRLLLVGREMQRLQAQHPHATWFATTDEAVDWIKTHLDRFGGDAHVLVKASRSMQLDRIVRAMIGKEGIHAL